LDRRFLLAAISTAGLACLEKSIVFDDKRSKKVVLLAQCVLNQNAKLDRCAHYPGAITEVADLLIQRGIGLVQMPCPELLFLGLDRQVDRSSDATFAAEDTRIAGRMAEPAAQALCNEIANNLVYQIGEYRKHGFEIVGLVGINGSPTCGVETTWRDDQDQAGPGALIQALIRELERKGYSLPMRGIKAYEPRNALAAVMELLA
jgi:predicted secreted protein